MERGGVIRNARLVWHTHGELSPARDNVIVYPCSFFAQHADLSWLVGPEGVLDPGRWFIVMPNMFSNGLSSSAADTPDYPAVVTPRDNVVAQLRLLSEQFGIERVAGVYGFSMGAQQAYHWAALYPDLVDRAVVVCGSARTAPHNKVFLSGLLRTLEAAPEYRGGGQFSAEPRRTLRAFAHIYAGWALSQDFYRAGLYRSVLGAADLDDYLDSWEDRYRSRRAANLYAQLVTWYHGDISANPLYEGDLGAALAAIRARVLLMPSESDLYFRVADSQGELAQLADARLEPIPSIWGHFAGNPADNPADFDFLRRQTQAWFATPQG